MRRTTNNRNPRCKVFRVFFAKWTVRSIELRQAKALEQRPRPTQIRHIRRKRAMHENEMYNQNNSQLSWLFRYDHQFVFDVFVLMQDFRCVAVYYCSHSFVSRHVVSFLQYVFAFSGMFLSLMLVSNFLFAKIYFAYYHLFCCGFCVCASARAHARRGESATFLLLFILCNSNNILCIQNCYNF